MQIAEYENQQSLEINAVVNIDILHNFAKGKYGKGLLTDRAEDFLLAAKFCGKKSGKVITAASHNTEHANI